MADSIIVTSHKMENEDSTESILETKYLYFLPSSWAITYWEQSETIWNFQMVAMWLISIYDINNPTFPLGHKLPLVWLVCRNLCMISEKKLWVNLGLNIEMILWFFNYIRKYYCNISRHCFINQEFYTFEGRKNYYTLILQSRENTTSNVNNNVIHFG